MITSLGSGQFDIHLGVADLEGQPPVFVGEVAGEDYLFVKSYYLVLCGVLDVDALGGVFLHACEVAHTLKFLRGLDVVGILVEEQPAAQVVETVTLKGEFYGSLAAHFAHECIGRPCVARVDSVHSGAGTHLVDSLYRGHPQK